MIEFRVVSCSSEDATAAPSAKLETGGMWSSDVPSKKAHVDIRFPYPVYIDSIEICNNGAAFIEILVGRDNLSNPKSMLPATSLMTMMEVRDGVNRNRVKEFVMSQVGKATVVEEKWQYMRVSLAQPFPPMTKLGLTWIRVKEKKGGVPGDDDVRRIHVPGTTMSPPPPVKGLMAKQESSLVIAPTLQVPCSDEDDDAPPPPRRIPATKQTSTVQPVALPPSTSTTATMSLISQWGKGGGALDPSPKPVATPKPTTTTTTTTMSKKVLPQSDEDDDAPPPPVARNPTSTRKKATPTTTTTTTTTAPPVPAPAPPKVAAPTTKPTMVMSKPVTTTTESTLPPPSLDRGLSEYPAVAKASPMKPLAGVVIVLSGYQNPLRGNIRDVAMKMGAGYKNNWESGCTHLICAFTNTPKIQEVKKLGGVGTSVFVVSHDWVFACQKDMKRVSEYPYAMIDGGGGKPPATSAVVYDDVDSGADTEEYEAPSPPSPPTPKPVATAPPPPPPKAPVAVIKSPPQKRVDREDDEENTPSPPRPPSLTLRKPQQSVVEPTPVSDKSATPPLKAKIAATAQDDESDDFNIGDDDEEDDFNIPSLATRHKNNPTVVKQEETKQQPGADTQHPLSSSLSSSSAALDSEGAVGQHPLPDLSEVDVESWVSHDVQRLVDSCNESTEQLREVLLGAFRELHTITTEEKTQDDDLAVVLYNRYWCRVQPKVISCGVPVFVKRYARVTPLTSRTMWLKKIELQYTFALRRSGGRSRSEETARMSSAHAEEAKLRVEASLTAAELMKKKKPEGKEEEVHEEEEEEDLLPPSILEGWKVGIHNGVDSHVVKSLQRMIITYGGVVVDCEEGNATSKMMTHVIKNNAPSSSRMVGKENDTHVKTFTVSQFRQYIRDRLL
eukprot:PhF_6_TR44278/c0_g1_i5/m.68230/K10803/XRCC1; DNA-repair protein XRCC1